MIKDGRMEVKEIMGGNDGGDGTERKREGKDLVKVKSQSISDDGDGDDDGSKKGGGGKLEKS